MVALLMAKYLVKHYSKARFLIISWNFLLQDANLGNVLRNMWIMLRVSKKSRDSYLCRHHLLWVLAVLPASVEPTASSVFRRIGAYSACFGRPDLEVGKNPWPCLRILPKRPSWALWECFMPQYVDEELCWLMPYSCNLPHWRSCRI